MKNNKRLKKLKHISFKHHKRQHLYAGPSTIQQNSPPKPPPQLFKDHAEFMHHANSSAMAPLFHLKTDGLLQLSYRADVNSQVHASPSLQDSDLSTLCHTEHSSTSLTCRKCMTFYDTYIKLSPSQAATLMEETKTQSASQLWHDARKLRLTASTAKRVPKRPTTDPKKFLNEHLYPTFIGNAATKYGRDNEANVIELLEDRGHVVERRGLVVHPEHDWLGASPDGIIDATQLLEIKCPFKSSTTLSDFLSRPNGDIKALDDGQYLMRTNGQYGYYVQVGKIKVK